MSREKRVQARDEQRRRRLREAADAVDCGELGGCEVGVGWSLPDDAVGNAGPLAFDAPRSAAFDRLAAFLRLAFLVADAGLLD